MQPNTSWYLTATSIRPGAKPYPNAQNLWEIITDCYFKPLHSGEICDSAQVTTNLAISHFPSFGDQSIQKHVLSILVLQILKQYFWMDFFLINWLVKRNSYERQEWTIMKVWTLGDNDVLVSFVSHNKCTTLVGVLVTGEVVHVGVRSMLVISVFSLNFAVNFILLFKKVLL